MMRFAIILDIRQACHFTERGLRVDAAISFCPTASHFLKEQGYKVISTSDHYDAKAHGDVVGAVASELPQLTKAATTQYALSAAETEGLEVYLYHYLCCVYHFHFALSNFDKTENNFTWWDGKTFGEGDYRMMFASIALAPSGPILSYAYTRYGALHAGLAALYNSIIYSLARRRRLKIMDYGDELSKRIISAVIANGDKPVVFNTHTVCKRAYKTTRFFIKSLIRLFPTNHTGKPVYVFRTTNPALYRETVAAFTIPEMLAEHVQDAARLQVERFVPFIRAEVAMGRAITQRLRPHIAVSDHAKYGYILSGLEAMRGYGGVHAMLNHGTHTIQYESTSKTAAILWAAQQRVINRHTTHSLPKSPLTAALTKRLRPDDSDYTIYPINVYGRIERQPLMTGPFVIVQAGNYTDAYNHIPWCKETADEYLLAIQELIEEVGRLENVELIIKLKNKKADTHKKIVEAHIAQLGVGAKVRVDTTSRFSDLMARAHLVVCNLSGTIEEALANRIPVLVHTYRKHYFHIAPETLSACEKDGLGPAYLIRQRADIPAIVTHLSARRAELGDPELYRTVTWQDGELVDLRTFASQLVASVVQ